MHEDDVLRFWHGLRGGGALEKRTRRPGSHHAHKRSTVHWKSPVEVQLGGAGCNIIASLAAKRALRGHFKSNIRDSWNRFTTVNCRVTKLAACWISAAPDRQSLFRAVRDVSEERGRR